jgi:hypothetical protein
VSLPASATGNLSIGAGTFTISFVEVSFLQEAMARKIIAINVYGLNIKLFLNVGIVTNCKSKIQGI